MTWQNAPDIALSEKKKQELNNQCDLNHVNTFEEQETSLEENMLD